MTSRAPNVPRATILRWLESDPGMTTSEVALRCHHLPAYVGERMRYLQRCGFVRSERMPDSATGRMRLCWFVDPNHPPLGRKTRPPLPRPREHLVNPARRPFGVDQQLVRVCRAPDRDSSIVAKALAAAPALQAAWMGMRG